MLKAELIALVAQQRAEISRLRTQLAAKQAPTAQAPVSELHDSLRSTILRKQAVRKLAERFPERKSFTAEEVRAAMA